MKWNKTISSSPSNLGTSSKTFFYDHNEGEWIIGPSLMEARELHAAGIVTDEMTDEELIAVTGGWSCGVLTSTEILQDGEWVQGILHISKIFLDPFILHCFENNTDLYKTFTYSFYKFEGTLANTEANCRHSLIFNTEFLIHIFIRSSFFSIFRTIAASTTRTAFNGEIRKRTSNTWRQ